MPPYPSAAIANYFIQKAHQDKTPLSPMKLLKIVYYAYGWHYALTDKPLISERIQAWRYGPVVMSLYYELKGYGNSNIAELILDTNKNPVSIDNDDSYVKSLLDRIWKMYSRFTASQLSGMTHVDGNPWHQTWSEVENNELFVEIDPDLVTRHFKKQLENATE